MKAGLSCNCNTGGGGEIDTNVQIIDPLNYTGNRITLRLWHGLTGQDGKVFEQIVQGFNEYYQNCIYIKTDSNNWDNVIQKLIQNKDDGATAPHLFVCGAERAYGLIKRDIFMPINELESLLEVSRKDYLEAAWDLGAYGTRNRYTYPLDIHPVALYYNKDQISEEEVPSNWDEFLAVCKEKTKDGKYGWSIPNQYSITKDVFYSMVLQDKSDILDKNNNPIFNNEECNNALRRLWDWKYVDKISQRTITEGGDKTYFTQGLSTFYFDGSWTITDFDRNYKSLNYGIAPIPGSLDENGSFAGTHQLAFVKSANTNSLLKSACYTFAKWFDNHSIEWAAAGQVPVKRSVLDSEQFKAIPHMNVLRHVAENANLGHTDFRWMYETYNYMGTAVSYTLNDYQYYNGQQYLNEKLLALKARIGS